MEHKGYLSADEIFRNRAAAARFFETILFSEPSPDVGPADIGVLATDCLRADLHVLGVQSRIIARDDVAGFWAGDELDGQLGMFQ